MPCVFCTSNDNLNTEMTVTLDDGNKISVEICDVHAEDATVKTAKAAYTSRQAQIAAVLEQAKALGLDLSQTSSGLTIVKSKPQPKSRAPEVVVPEVDPTIILEDEEDVCETTGIDVAAPMSRVTVASSLPAGVSASGGRNYGIGKDKLPDSMMKGKAKIEVMEGRGGMPIAIPAKKVDGMGTTRIKITNTGDKDNDLQKRFKNMADSSKADPNNNRAPDFRNGYGESVKICPICHGDGEVMNAAMKINCPKCGGSGEISVY